MNHISYLHMLGVLKSVSVSFCYFLAKPLSVVWTALLQPRQAACFANQKSKPIDAQGGALVQIPTLCESPQVRGLLPELHLQAVDLLSARVSLPHHTCQICVGYKLAFGCMANPNHYKRNI